MWPSRDAGSGLGTVSHLPPAEHRCFRSTCVAGGCFGESSVFLQHTRVIHKQKAQQWTPDAEPPQWDASKTGMSSQMRVHVWLSPDPAPEWHPGTHQPFPFFPSTDPKGPHHQEMLKMGASSLGLSLSSDQLPQMVPPLIQEGFICLKFQMGPKMAITKGARGLGCQCWCSHNCR